MSSLACVKSQFTRTHVSPREGTYPELELLLLLLSVVLQKHPHRVWLAAKVMGWWVWVWGASPGPQHLGTTSTCSEKSTSWCTKPCQSSSWRSLPVTWTNNCPSSEFGGLCSNLTEGTTRVSPQFTTHRRKSKSFLTNCLKACQAAVEESPSSCFAVRK